MSGSVKRFMKGQTRVRIEGSGVLRCLNLLLGKEAEVRGARRQENGLELWVDTDKLGELERCAQKSGCRVEVVRAEGFPKWRKNYGNRYGFLAGILLAVAVMFFLNCYIWRLDIRGNESVSDAEVIRRLKEYGLGEGVWKSGKDLEKIKNELLLQYPEWAWLSLSIEGATLEVRLEEATAPPEIQQEGSPSDLVADQEGIIYSIVTKHGKPQVRAGDVVRTGDVLISGTMEFEKEDGTTGYRYTQAQGDVYAARTEYLEAEVSENYMEKIYTGDRVSELWLLHDGQAICLYHPFRNLENTDCLEEMPGAGFSNFLEKLPILPHIRLLRRTYFFYETVPRTYREDQMKVLLNASLQKQKEALVSDCGAEILEEKTQYTEWEQGIRGILEVKLLQRIGVSQVIPMISEENPS